MNPLLKGFTSAARPPDRSPAWVWCERHVVVDNTSPMPGKWRADNSPWVKEVMEAFQDNAVRDITVKCSAQSSKTQTIMNCACWAISEDPGPALWVTAAKDEAADFVNDRIAPTFENCLPVKRKMTSRTSLHFDFDGMPFYFVGAGSKSKLQSKPIRWLFLDEVRNYKRGALETVLKRTRAFWNSRRVIISTPDLAGDAVDRAYLSGDQRTWFFPCPNCGHEQRLLFEQLKAVNPATGLACKWKEVPGAYQDGRWNYDALAPHIRYQCVSCGHLIADTPSERKHISRHGRFVKMNPKAPRHKVSFHWNSLLPTWVPWRSIVEEFIQARAAARAGDIHPLKTFINETLGESWDDALGIIDDYEFLNARKQDYDWGETWPEERARFMAADKQESGGEHYWWVIRAYGSLGHSRLVAYGRCSSFEELEILRKQYNVPVRNALIDSGYKATQVYRFCAATGWKAFKGDDAQYFLHRDPRTKLTYRRIWDRTYVDPLSGTKLAGRTKPLPLYRFSNNGAKDLLAHFTTGLIGEWTIPASVPNDYLKQLTAERRVEVQDRSGHVHYMWEQVRRDNHLLDCELMLLVAGVITGLVSASKSQSDGGAGAGGRLAVTA